MVLRPFRRDMRDAPSSVRAQQGSDGSAKQERQGEGQGAARIYDEQQVAAAIAVQQAWQAKKQQFQPGALYFNIVFLWYHFAYDGFLNHVERRMRIFLNM